MNIYIYAVEMHDSKQVHARVWVLTIAFLLLAIVKIVQEI
jgi:hypothetical protein